MTELSTPPARSSAPGRRRSRLLAGSRAEAVVWGALVVAALVLRLVDLGSRPFHHDESQDAYFSWVFYDRGDYAYQPILHGPLRFYLTATMYVLFGDSDVTARLAPALMGTAVVGLAFLLRRHIGALAALVAGALLAFGPSYLYFSRFAREDVYVAAITLGLVVAMFRFLDRPRPVGPPVIAALLALLWATKKTVFITGFTICVFLAAAVVVQARGPGGWREGRVVRAIRAVGWVPWVYALATFLLVFALLFTVFFTNPDGLRAGFVDGIDYWLGQQPVNRGGEPWYFYLAVLFGVEWPVLVLGAVGIAWSLRHPTTERLFLVWFFGSQLAIYSWASERFSWLVLHPLLPLILLAGLGVQALWAGRPAPLRVAAGVVVAACLAYSAYASFLANARFGADPRSWLVSTQSSVEVKDVADHVRGLAREARSRTGRRLSVTVDTSEGATFPYAWYFRDLEAGYIDMRQTGYVPDSQVLIMTEGSRAVQRPNLTAYEGRRFRFRVWWVREWSKALEPGAWWRWFTTTRPWNETGGMDEWLYVRTDAGRP